MTSKIIVLRIIDPAPAGGVYGVVAAVVAVRVLSDIIVNHARS